MDWNLEMETKQHKLIAAILTTINHVIQSGPYQVTAAIDGAGQIRKWDVVGT